MEERSEREAIAWHDRLERDRSPDTLAAFERWRSDPRNAFAFEQQARLADKLPYSAFRAARPRPAMRGVAWPTFAAAGAIAVALVAFWPGAHLSGPAPLTSTGTPLLMLTRPVRLLDGSYVVLGAGARVAATPRGARRQVRLSGGPARFIIAPNPVQPFVALVGAVSVAARDGVFDVEPTSRGPRVTIIDGHAEVSRDATGGTDTVGLAVGQTLDPAAPTPQATPPERRGRLGPLEVDRMTVADVLAIAERAAETRILLADPAISARRITGRFDVGDGRRLARKLAAALDLAVDEHDGIIALRPR